MGNQVNKALGLEFDHLVSCDVGKPGLLMDERALEAFFQLKDTLVKEGFELSVVSAYRDFQRQMAIFNQKAQGLRPVLDENGIELDVSNLTSSQLLFHILRWSALPGLSRHHFGTDIDVFDGNTQKLDEVQLTPAEVEVGGPAYAMHNVIDQLIETNNSFGFFKPYLNFTGGISPERWHLSYYPVSCVYENLISLELLLPVWEESGLALLGCIVDNFDDIYSRFVQISPQNKPFWCK